MDNKEIMEIQLEEIMSVWRTIHTHYKDKKLSKRMYELENDKENLTYIQGYLDALIDLEICIEPEIERLDEDIKAIEQNL